MQKRLLVSFILATGIAVAQFGAGSRTYTARHTSDYSDQQLYGRCVVRVVVDQQADIELRWDRVRIQTIRGRPARDNGTECNSPLPQSNTFSNFQVRGFEGRGDIVVREQPNASNGWAAIVRISDPAGGEGAYAYEVTWSNMGSGRGRDGNWSQSSSYDPTSACRSAFRQRLRQDDRGQFIGWINEPRSWQSGNRSILEGVANVRGSSGTQRMQINCSVNPMTGTVESLNYEPADGQFFPGNTSAGSVLGLCQDQLRTRFQQDFNSSNVQFYDTPDRWMDGRTERIMGNGYMTAPNGRRINFGYSCAGDPVANTLDWSDYQTARRSGSN